nr:arginine--tRNA ligase [Saprospiraceae bacterium]
MQFFNHIAEALTIYFKDEYEIELSSSDVQIQPTRKEFEGEYTLVVFPLSARVKKAPPVFAEELGEYLMLHSDFVDGYNVVKGFLNMSLSAHFWREMMEQVSDTEAAFKNMDYRGRLVLEYSSPNTNKPLHLGHIRNILLGWSMYKIKQRCGHEVIRTQIVNDRGVAICKSMWAWDNYAEGETPDSSGLKGDHLIGKYYVTFDKVFNEEYALWQNSDEAQKYYKDHAEDGQSPADFFKKFKNRYFNEHSKIGSEVRKMLLLWEEGDPQVTQLWKKMNDWVYAGFKETYDKLEVTFDKTYYESDTYKLGKDLVEQGLEKGIFYRKDDGSIWVDLTDAGMDEKLLLRGDGTAVYMTQDLGTARVRYDDFKMSEMTYVVGNEQDYHFKVLFEVLKRLEESYADGLYHLSYGMVDLPGGRMKSREGNVVDADDLIEEVIQTAHSSVTERGGLEGFSEEDQKENIRRIAMGALKFHLLKVNPKKRMVFNPEESLDMQGHTGPYVQNAYVRIQSITRKMSDHTLTGFEDYRDINEEEKALIQLLLAYREVVLKSADEHDPSHLANFLYQLGKTYHRFYHEHHILRAESDAAMSFRFKLSQAVGQTLEDGMELLGISMPERM